MEGFREYWNSLLNRRSSSTSEKGSSIGDRDDDFSDVTKENRPVHCDPITLSELAESIKGVAWFPEAVEPTTAEFEG